MQYNNFKKKLIFFKIVRNSFFVYYKKNKKILLILKEQGAHSLMVKYIAHNDKVIGSNPIEPIFLSGVQPSGKALVFDTNMRRFKSFYSND